MITVQKLRAKYRVDLFEHKLLRGPAGNVDIPQGSNQIMTAWIAH